MRKCDLSKIQDVFAKIASANTLYLPVDGTDGKAAFRKWEEGQRGAMRSTP